MTSNSRRRFLQTVASSAGAAAALTALPESIRNALAVPAFSRTGTIRDVEHIVVFMQENRSFDHYFGHMRGVRGYNDRFPIPLPSGKPVWYPAVEGRSDETGAAVPSEHADHQRAMRGRSGSLVVQDALPRSTAAATTSGPRTRPT